MSLGLIASAHVESGAPAAVAYLNSATSRATTPDPGSFNIPFVLKAKVRGPQIGTTTDQTIASQYTAGQRAVNWVRRGVNGNVNVNVTTDGTTLLQLTGGTIAIDLVNPIYIASSIDSSSGTNTFHRRWTSTDGVTWSSGSATANTLVAASIWDSTAVVRIGGKDADSSVGRFDDRIYWVEMRTGIDPNAGTLLWRFDAVDHVSGTSWTDPRGNTWTITDAAGIVHV